MSSAADSPIFELSTVGVRAQGYSTPDRKFVVLSGSQARAEVKDSYERYVPAGYRKHRDELIANGVLRPDPSTGELIFTRDEVFNGTTEAGCVIAGRMVNGIREWFIRLPDGMKQTQAEWLMRPSAGEDTPVFMLKTEALSAFAQMRQGKFVVLAGSEARPGTADTMATADIEVKRRLLEQHILQPKPNSDLLEFAEDTPFTSASEASGVILLRSRGGSSGWYFLDAAGKEVQFGQWMGIVSKLPEAVRLTRWGMTATAKGESSRPAGPFPFSAFQEDAQQFEEDRVKGNLVLDRKYAPLLLEAMSGDWAALKPSRSPYSGREQLAVKVGLGGGVKIDKGAFARALLFADDSGFEYVPFPAGLTLEAGWPDGRGDGPRLALHDPDVWDQVLAALHAPLPDGVQATLTLNTDFGPLSLQPLGPGHEEEAARTLERYRDGLGLSRRLRVGLSLLPRHLESDAFPELLSASLVYLDALVGDLDQVMQHGGALPRQPESVIEVPGTETTAPQDFTPVPGVPLNQILYGPPGTGKTYQVVDEALAVLDPEFLAGHPGSEGRTARKARYDQLAAEGRISFVTFHQSFGYEDFIEGIKPVMAGGALSYELQDGVFLNAVRAAGGGLPPAATRPTAPSEADLAVRPDAQVWRMYIDGSAPVSRIRDLSLARGELRMGSFRTAPRDLTHLGVEELSGRQLLFKDSMRAGDLVLLATGVDRIGAVAIVTGDYRFDPHSDPAFATDYAHTRSVNWLATGLNVSATDSIGKSFAPPTLQRVIGLSPEQVLRALGLPSPAKTSQSPALAHQRPHVLIIDEINRGNISKIFGELMTLLESGKRAGAPEALTATLPLSRRPLSIPQSLYVIGTMNTADRSLTLLDAALRRRFVFKPVWPEPELLPVLTLDGTGLDLRKFLFVINDRIERLLSREQVIGHAYLLGLPATLEGVASALRERILPLLEEYFFEDWNKIREVLGDHGKPPEAQFIHQTGKGSEVRYRLNPQAFGNIEAFTGVYAQVSDEAFPFIA